MDCTLHNMMCKILPPWGGAIQLTRIAYFINEINLSASAIYIKCKVDGIAQNKAESLDEWTICEDCYSIEHLELL